MGREEGFGIREFLLWVSKNRGPGLVLVVIAERVTDYGAGVGGEGTGFAERCEKDCHYHVGDADYGWKGTRKPLDSTRRGQNRCPV